jgi:hypothetical protein
MAVGFIRAASSCTGCEKIEVDQEIDKVEEDDDSSRRSSMTHGLGTLTLFHTLLGEQGSD